MTGERLKTIIERSWRGAASMLGGGSYQLSPVLGEG